MQKFFEELYSTKLERKRPEMTYVLGDKALEHALGLDNTVAALSPTDAQMELFATSIYLYGLLGYILSDFTSVPAGYLCAFKKEVDEKSEHCTALISEGTFGEYRKKLSELFKAESLTEELSLDCSRFFLDVSSLLKEKKYFGHEKMLVEFINSKIHTEPKLSLLVLPDGSTFPSRIASAKDAIDFNGKDSVNKRNCDDNQVLLERIAACIHEEAGEKIPSKETLKEDGKVILKEFILPYYKKYISGEGDILTSFDLVARFGKIFGSVGRATLALNICSTDFSADKVNEILGEIVNCTEPESGHEAQRSRIEEVDKRKTDARRVLHQNTHRSGTDDKLTEGTEKGE